MVRNLPVHAPLPRPLSEWLEHDDILAGHHSIRRTCHGFYRQCTPFLGVLAGEHHRFLASSENLQPSKTRICIHHHADVLILCYRASQPREFPPTNIDRRVLCNRERSIKPDILHTSRLANSLFSAHS